MIPAESKSNRVPELDLAESSSVRTRVSASDPFQGLKGHDYIKARNLNQPVQRVQTSAHTELGTAATVTK